MVTENFSLTTCSSGLILRQYDGIMHRHIAAILAVTPRMAHAVGAQPIHEVGVFFLGHKLDVSVLTQSLFCRCIRIDKMKQMTIK